MAFLSVVKTEPLKAGHGAPKKLLGWLNSLLGDIKAIEPMEGKNIALRRLNPGTEINATGSGSGGGGGGDNLEEITGAVNGVPSTLQVQTDGNGWTAI